MRESEIQSDNHRIHALEWRSEDTCLMCLMEAIRADSTRMRIHRRFALATFIQKLNLDVTQPSASQRENLSSSRSLAKLLQKNSNVSSQVLNTLLDALTVADLVDLAVDAVYQLYHKVLRDDAVLDTVLTHSLQKIGESLYQPEKWVPYLSILQRLVQLVPSAVALALSQNAKLENEIVGHLSDHFNEFVALHIIVLLDPIIRSDDRILLKANRRPGLMFQIAHLLQSAQCQQLQFASLGFALALWIKEDFNQLQDTRQIQQLTVATVNGLKRIVLQSSLPDMQVAALQVLDSLLVKCSQLTGGLGIVTRLLEEQDVAELMYDTLYGNHLPLLEYALRCLHHLSQCPSFFQHRWIILGVEPLVRVIPQLAVSNASAVNGGLIVVYAIHLLSEMLSKYEGGGEDSILLNGGFDAACGIATMALGSGAHHLETGGTCLVAALLHHKNLPVPIPTDRLLNLIQSCLTWLVTAPQNRKWGSESGQVHLRAIVRVLSTATKLIVHLTDDPRARFSSYATAPIIDQDGDIDDDQVASFSDPSIDKMIELIITTVGQLISILQQVNEDVLWSEFLILLRQLGGSSAAGCEYVDKTLKTSALLNLSFHLRRSEVGRDSANDLLSFFLARCLHQPGNLLVGGPLTTLASLVALIPTSTAELADWIGPDRRAPFGAKCSAIVLLYQLELGCSSAATSNDGDETDLFVGEDHCEAVVSSIGELMLSASPCDMDDVDLLRSIWFLIAKYSQYGSSTTTEASKAFVHLVKWFQPNGSLLLAWLRRIYTPHLCLIRWAFSSNDIASYIGSYMILLWIDDVENAAAEDDPHIIDGEKAKQLVQLCLQPTQNGHLLLLSIFELVFFDERGDGRIGSMATALLITVAEKSDTARQTIGRMTKYNIPRFLRLTDVTVDDTNYARLVGSLRLLCRLSCSRSTDLDDGTTSWKDPSIVSALVSFLPRTLRSDGDQFEGKEQQGQFKLGTLELWSWACRYLERVMVAATETTSSRPVLSQIVMENRAFLDFVDQIFSRDQLPVWKDVAGLVAGLAAFHQLHGLKVVVKISVSLHRLARRLTAGLVASDGDSAESLDALLQLIGCCLQCQSNATDSSSLLRDPWLDAGVCGDEMRHLVHHLWATLINWTMRIGPAKRDRLFATLCQLMEFVSKSLPDDQLTALASHPWNYVVLMDAVDVDASPNAIHLARQLVKHSANNRVAGTHPWSSRLQERLDGRHAQS